MYKDVRLSGMESKIHFLKYGEDEGRFKNVYSFLNYYEPDLSKYILNFILGFLFNLTLFFRETFFSKQILILISLLENIKLRKYRFSFVNISSWIEGGVKEAERIYLDILVNQQEVEFCVLRGIKDFEGTKLQPMNLAVWRGKKVIDHINLLNPVETINRYNKIQSRIEVVHIHHFFGIEKNVSDLVQKLESNFVMFIHDYYLLTTNFHLFDDVFGQISLEDCIIKYPNTKINLNLFKSKINKFVCPSKYVYNVFEKHIPIQNLEWLYHPEIPQIESLSVTVPKAKNCHNILVIGNMGAYKGSQKLNEVVHLVRLHNFKFKFLHIGLNPVTFDDDKYLNFQNITREELLPFCEKMDISFAFLPFQSPETYSFVLSDVFKLHFPLISVETGAIIERCLGRPLTILLNLNFNGTEALKSFEKVISGEKIDINYFVPQSITSKRQRHALQYEHLFRA
jgi:hypothetical protein